MLGLGALLLIVWAILSILGEAFEVLLKVGLVLIIVGAVLDVLTGFRAYTWFRR